MSSPNSEADVSRLVAENQSLRAALARRRRWRQVLTAVLVVLTSVSVVLASTAVWVRQVVFDSDRFMETVGPVLDNEDFYSLIGERASASTLEALSLEPRVSQTLDDVDRYLSEALVDALDPSDRARAVLDRFERPTLAALAPAITAALEARVDQTIQAFFGSDAFASRFPDLVRRVHSASVALARDELSDLPNVYVQNAAVRLNLIPLIVEALQPVADDLRAVTPDLELPAVVSDRVEEGREQFAAAVQRRLPDDFGQVTIMSAAALSEVQAVAVQADRYVWLAVVAAILLLVLTVAVSPRRRATAVHLGIGVLAAVVVVELVVRQLRAAVVDQVADPRGAALAGDLVDSTLSSLRTAQLVLAVVAVLVAVVAYLVGRPAWATRLTRSVSAGADRAGGESRWEEWLCEHAGPLRVAGIAVALVALLVAGPQPVPLVVIALALAAYLWFLSAVSRRATSEPDGEVTAASSSAPR